MGAGVEQAWSPAGMPQPGDQGLERHPAEMRRRRRSAATLAARGRTSPEIAAALHVSVRTVDTHLSRVYRKLMIHGRRELAAALGLGADT